MAEGIKPGTPRPHAEIERPLQESPSERTPSPGASSEDSLEIKPTPLDPVRLERQQAIVQEQINSLGWFPSKKDKVSIKTHGPMVAPVIDQIEQTLGGVPLDKKSKQLLFQLKMSTDPIDQDMFNQLQSFSKPAPAGTNEPDRTPGMEVAIGEQQLNYPPEEIVQLKTLVTEIGMARSLNNTQFNADGLMGIERREGEIKGYQDLINRNTKHKNFPQNSTYCTDPTVLAAQGEHVQSAQNWAQENGFENTRWFPSGLSGHGLLFCADFDPIEQTNGGPLKVSRHIGIMLGDRVRMTRIETTIPGDFSQEDKKKILANFSQMKNPAATAFMDECETQIQQMHAELTQNQGSPKMVFKEGALKRAVQVTEKLKTSGRSLDNDTQSLIQELSYVHPAIFQKLADFIENPTIEKNTNLVSSLYDTVGERLPNPTATLQSITSNILAEQIKAQS